MHRRPNEQAIVRKLNLIWFALLASVPLISLAVIYSVVVHDIELGPGYLDIPDRLLWTGALLLTVAALLVARIVRSTLMTPQRLASGPLNAAAREPASPLGKAETRLMATLMIVASILDLPGLIMLGLALYATDVALLTLATVCHLTLFMLMKPDFSRLLQETLAAMTRVK